MSVHMSRRQMLGSVLASSSFGFAIRYPTLTSAQSAAPTPQCNDGDEATATFFFHVGTGLPFFANFLLIKETRQAMCWLRCRGTNPGQ